MRNWKRTIKRAVQSAAAAIGRHRWKPRQPVLLVLTYHRVLPPGHNDLRWMQPGMVVSPQTLRMHIQVLRQFFELVDLADWTDRARQGAPLPAKACALTFDDGWRDNYEYAFPVLREVQAPATIFVVSDMVNTLRSFWPERLARLLCKMADKRMSELGRVRELAWLRELGIPAITGDVNLNRIAIDAAIIAAKRLSDIEIEERLDAAESVDRSLTGPDQRDMLNWGELKEMMASKLVRVGSHTRRHRRLHNGMGRESMWDEIVHSKELIQGQLDATVPLFCYPNGDWSPEAEQLVRDHYSGACLTTRGWNRQSDDPYRLRRIGVHEDISGERVTMLARISGWV